MYVNALKLKKYSAIIMRSEIRPKPKIELVFKTFRGKSVCFMSLYFLFYLFDWLLLKCVPLDTT